MKKKQHIGHTMKLVYRIARQRGFNKHFLRILYFLIGCFVLFTFIAIFTLNMLFAKIMIGVMYIIGVVGVIGIILHIRDIVQQIKRENASPD